MFSFPAAPLIWKARSLTAPRVARLAVVPDATLTRTVSVAPLETPLIAKVWPASWAPEKVPVRPLPTVTDWTLAKVTPVMSRLAVRETVLVPAPPSTASFTATSVPAV